MLETASEMEVLDRIMCVGEPHVFSPLVRRYIEHPTICEVPPSDRWGPHSVLGWGREMYAVNDVEQGAGTIRVTHGIRTNTPFRRVTDR